MVTPAKPVTAGVMVFGAAASLFRTLTAQLAETTCGLTTKISARLAAVRNVVRTIGKMAVWLRLIMFINVISDRVELCLVSYLLEG